MLLITDSAVSLLKTISGNITSLVTYDMRELFGILRRAPIRTATSSPLAIRRLTVETETPSQWATSAMVRNGEPGKVMAGRPAPTTHQPGDQVRHTGVGPVSRVSHLPTFRFNPGSGYRG